MEILVLLSSVIIIYSVKYLISYWEIYIYRRGGCTFDVLGKVKYIAYTGWTLLVLSSLKIVWRIIYGF